MDYELEGSLNKSDSELYLILANQLITGNLLQFMTPIDDEEKKLQSFIDSDPRQKEKYGTVLSEIDEVYKDAFITGRRNLVLLMLSRNVDYFRLAEIFIEYKKEMLKPEAERKSIYKEDKRGDFYNTITNLYNDYMPDLDPQILYKIII